MARLEQLPEASRARLEALECPVFDSQPWVDGPPLAQRRMSIVSTAGLHCRDDRPFLITPTKYGGVLGDYRIIPGDVQASDLIMSHVSTNFDRTGFQQDWNVMFPLDRLRELAAQGTIGSVADYHYSFMGATDPRDMEPSARNLAQFLKQDQVNAVLLVPV